MRRPRWREAGIPAAVVVVAAVEVAVLRPDGAPFALVLLGAAGIGLVFRREWPLLVGLGAGMLALSLPWVGPELDELSTPVVVVVVAAYAMARWRRGHLGLLVLVGYLGFAALGILHSYSDPGRLADLFFVLVLLAPPYAFGKVARRLEDSQRALEAAQDQIRSRAARDERDRIARDLHDVIAHSVSAIVVQTAAAQDLVRSDPDRAEKVLADMAAAGRRALAETGDLLHVMRDADDELGLAPPPTMALVPGLVEQFRGRGLRVELDWPSDLPEVP